MLTVTSAEVTSPAPPTRRFLAGSILVAAAIVLLGQTLATGDRPTSAVVWGGLSLAAYLVGLLFLIGPGQSADPGLTRWKIGSWILLWYSLVFGITTVTLSQPQIGVPAEIALPSVLRALWLVAVGMTVWVAGYRLGPAQPIRRQAARAVSTLRERFGTEVRSPAAPWILYAIGTAASLGNTATTGKFGYVGTGTAVNTASFGGVLGAVGLCAPLAVAAAALQVFRERRPGARFTLTVLVLLQLAFGGASGGKQSFALTALALIIPFSASHRRLPVALTTVFVLVFLVVVVPFNQTYRDDAVEGALTVRQAVAAAPTILRQTVADNSVVTVLRNSMDYLARRIRDIDSPAIVMQRTPMQLSFRSPLQLIEAPLAGMVPRALWPGKPILLTGPVFNEQFYEAGPNTSTSPTLVGGLYWYGGWLPVVIGMFLFGIGVRLFDDVIDVCTNPQGIFLVLLLFPSLVRGEYDWISIVSSMPGTIFAWLLAVAIIFPARRLV